MLKASEINYPITFNSHGVGKFIFNSATDGFKYNCGRASRYNGTVHHFIDQHNRFNPNNIKERDYYYEMAEHNTVNAFMFGDNVKIYTASIGVTDYRICKIEEMPVGATLKGIQDCNGEWNEITFKPGRVEVHDDVITLLSGYAGWRPKGDKAYGAEINIKRGTNVKFS
ncbi:hypothetical protein PQ125_002647 [Salmonella enterica]|nr:hypothetical protein [Salmonella enterica]